MKKTGIQWGIAFSLTALLVLTGCETTGPVATDGVARPVVSFVDLDQFDKDLSLSLNAQLAQVEVPFYDHTSPNKMPERMKTWLNHVERTGGHILVEEPPSSSGVTAKNPFLIFSIINAIKTLSEASQKAAAEKNYFSATKGHDVKVVLKRNSDNETVVDKIIFLKSAS
jgi:hypothetical protein